MVLQHIAPQGGGTEDTQSAVKAEFAANLRAALQQKGWTASEAARRVAQFLNYDDKFGRAHLWQYLQGRALPRPRYLFALSRALELEPSELLPGMPLPEDAAHRTSGVPALPAPDRDMVHLRDYGDGTTLLQVSQRVAWDTALKVLALLKPHGSTGDEV